MSENILATEFSEEFVRLMKNRMVTSYYKYGPVKTNMQERYTNILASLQLRFNTYLETGNTEFMVDVANMAMMEFMYPQHPKGYFKGTDAEESPGMVGMAIREAELFAEGVQK